MLTGTLSPVSNHADWIEVFELTDADTGEPVDISTATEIVIEIKDSGCDRARLDAKLSADEITHIETGIFQWAFSASEMRGLCAGTYDVRLRIKMDDIETQLFIGYLPVLDG